jgi:hypothetical protein
MEKNWVDNDHYRLTSDDGRESWLYERHDNVLGHTDVCIERADHFSDGTTKAYEYDYSLTSAICSGGRGKEK